MHKSFGEEVQFELEFWTQVLGDHSRFIHDSLAPSEKKYIQKAEQFITQFDGLLERVRSGITSQQSLIKLVKEAKKEGEALRKFKLTIIKQHLVGKIKIMLTPSFVNHMVNELDEALRLFSHYEKGERAPDVHPLHHDLLWLLDAAGHAGAIDSNLDRVEKQLKKHGEQFTKDWEAFYLKAVEMAGYLRANVSKFPALSRFHQDIELEMTLFKHFLRELEEMELRKETLGILTPLMADHMAREECYYLTKLSETTDVVKQPDCDPTKERTQG